MRKSIALLAVAATLVPAGASMTQDTLTPYLEVQRQNNIRNHQLRMAKRNAERRASTRTAASTPDAPKVTLMQRQGAWNANKSEYRKRLLRDGKTSADRWLDGLVVAGRK